MDKSDAREKYLPFTRHSLAALQKGVLIGIPRLAPKKGLNRQRNSVVFTNGCVVVVFVGFIVGTFPFAHLLIVSAANVTRTSAHGPLLRDD